MHSRPPFFTEDSIRSRDISDPQAYRLSYSVPPHQVTQASKRASKMASILKRESAPAPAPTQSRGASYKPGIWLYMAFATLGVLTIMVALDATALSVALPVIAEKLNGSALEAFWAATSYLLTSTVFQPTIASFSNAFGRRWVTTGSVIIFLIGLLVSGTAQNFTLLLAGRAVQGIGGGGIIVLTQLIICDLIPLRLRGQFFGIISGMYAIGSVSGPLVGGAFSEKVTWRWIFWINLPFTGAALVMIPLFIKLRVAQTSFFQKLAKIDWIGSVLFIASTTGFLIPLSWGGVSYPWNSWRTYVPLSVSALGLVIVWMYEEYVAVNPIIRTSIFKNRNAAAAYIGVVIHGMVVVGSLYYLPLYYEAVQGLSPILSGVALFPETFTVAPGAFIVGTLISRTGRYRWAVWSGWAITTLGLGLLYLLDVNTSTVEWIFLNLVVGVGLGFNYSALGVTLQAATSEEDMTSAVAMFTFFRLMGQALGVVIGGVTFQNEIRSKLLAIPSLAPMADQYANDGAALAQQISSIKNSDDRANVIQVYADSLKTVWAVLCGVAALALLTSFIITDLSLDREFISPQQLPNDSDDAVLLDNKVEEGGPTQEVSYGTAETAAEMTALPHWYGNSASSAAQPEIPRRSSRRDSRWLSGFTLAEQRLSQGPRTSGIATDTTITPTTTNNKNNKRGSVRFSQTEPPTRNRAPADESDDHSKRASYQSSLYTHSTTHNSANINTRLPSPPPAHHRPQRRHQRGPSLPDLPTQPSLAEMMVDDFDADEELPTILPYQRQSRIESRERPKSWAPVYGMG
ncbi:major facilitator superfamily domain-containing protein [Usnea florida]